MTQTIKKRLNALPNPSRRKLTLFACSCVREVWHLLEDESKNAVIAAEKYADGLINREEMRQAADAVYYGDSSCLAAVYAALAAADTTYTYAYTAAANAYTYAADDAATAVAYTVAALGKTEQALAKQHQLFDDIFGS